MWTRDIIWITKEIVTMTPLEFDEDFCQGVISLHIGI